MTTATTTAVQTLEQTLRDLIEPDRQVFVKLVFDQLKAGIQRFIERHEWKTEFEYFKPHRGAVEGLREATDYNDAERKHYYEEKAYRTKQNWPVAWKPDADAILTKLAQDIAESYIRTFLTRAMEKLSPVVERRPEYKAARQEWRHVLTGGAWVGSLHFTFADGMEFWAQLQIKTNFSIHGNAYAQYPCTFHEAVLTPGEKPHGASIEDIWKVVGYTPPPKPTGPPRRRWTKVVSGSVVEHNGKPTLIRTPGMVKKLGIAPDAPQLARIEVATSTGRIEYIDGRIDRWKYPAELDAQAEILRRSDKLDAEKPVLMEAIFRHFYPEV